MSRNRPFHSCARNAMRQVDGGARDDAGVAAHISVTQFTQHV